jgi:hypothetical protein
MADITRTVLNLNEASKLEAVSKSAACTIDCKGGDYKTLIILTNAGGSSATATFSIGNGIQGVGEALEVVVPSGETHAIVLDSGYFKNTSGEKKDAVVVTPSAALSITAVELPQ